MTQCIVAPNERGFTTVWIPTGEVPLEDVLAKDCPPGAFIINADALPSDNEFFDAWKVAGNAVTVDMPAARGIWRDKMRQARAPKLAALDVEFMRAVERGDAAAQADIAARKQALRDVTADPAIESAATTAELRAVWPAILG